MPKKSLSTVRRTRRSCGTIHLGHLDEQYFAIEKAGEGEGVYAFFESLKSRDWVGMGYTAGAFALEIGERTERVHIQFYVEHGQKRATTLAKQFGVERPEVFYDTVKSPSAAWDYCVGQGKFEDKQAFDRFIFGDPILFGGSEGERTLSWCVNRIMSGVTPADVMRENPYAYAVHRERIWNLYRDLLEFEQRGVLTGPPRR